MAWLSRLLARDTPYADPNLELVLPGVWRSEHEPTHLSCAQEQESQQVTIAAYKAKRASDMPTLLVAVLDIVHFTELETEYLDGGVNIAFTATDAGQPAQVRFVVMGRPARVVSFTYN